MRIFLVFGLVSTSTSTSSSCDVTTLTLYPHRGSSSELSMAVGALGRPLGAPPGPPGSA